MTISGTISRTPLELPPGVGWYQVNSAGVNFRQIGRPVEELLDLLQSPHPPSIMTAHVGGGCRWRCTFCLEKGPIWRKDAWIEDVRSLLSNSAMDDLICLSIPCVGPDEVMELQRLPGAEKLVLLVRPDIQLPDAPIKSILAVGLVALSDSGLAALRRGHTVDVLDSIRQLSAVAPRVVLFVNTHHPSENIAQAEETVEKLLALPTNVNFLDSGEIGYKRPVPGTVQFGSWWVPSVPDDSMAAWDAIINRLFSRVGDAIFDSLVQYGPVTERPTCAAAAARVEEER